MDVKREKPKLLVHVFSMLVIIVLSVSIPAASQAENSEFEKWLDGLKAEAREKGISENTLEVALSGLEPIERVIELDRHQPEFKLEFGTYMDKVVSGWRIRKGRELLAQHRELLEGVADRYGVPPRFLVAFWGIETNFGRTLGSFPVIQSLATLAFDPRRSDFFRRELLNALRIVDDGHIDVRKMKGSWAGAMGQVQFMPSTFVRFAMDGDGDGKKDIWNSFPDAMESASNFLSRSGWVRGVTWGREVKLPPDFDGKLTGLDTKKSLKEWGVFGVLKADGTELPDGDIKGSIVLPSDNKGTAFLVYKNFRVILRWNRSIFYGVAVGNLADRIVGKGPLRTVRNTK